MNKTAIIALANLLTNIPSKYNTGFNMTGYSNSVCDVNYTHVGHQCGSTACIAGWATSYIEPDGSVRMKPRSPDEMRALVDGVPDPELLGFYGVGATKILGLDPEQAAELFEPMNNGLDDRDWDAVTPRQAAKVLRHLAKTGEVSWEVAFS